MAKLHRDDLMKATLSWVIGECWEWNAHYKQFPADSDAFHQFCLRTHGIVWKYLVGRQVLDGTCSDTECTLALKAHRIFETHLEAQV